MPILVSTSSKEDASMRKQTFVPFGLNAQEWAVVEMPTQEVVKLLGFMEETRMSLGVALGHEEPPWDPCFEYRWPFQLGKPLIRPELVLKLSPKMYEFHEWYMLQSLKGTRRFCHWRQQGGLAGIQRYLWSLPSRRPEYRSYRRLVCVSGIFFMFVN
jgi:hypothetical protein